MANLIRSFSAGSTIENATTLSGTTEELTSDVDMETAGYVGAHLTVDFDWDASGTIDVAVSFYGSLDGTNYDDVAFFSQQIACPSADQTDQYSFIIHDFLHFRVGFAHVAAEGDECTITCKEQRWFYTSS